MAKISIGKVKTSEAAWHPDKSEDFYELWDFYSLFEDGHKCIAQFYSRPWYPLMEYDAAEANKPMTILRIITPDNTNLVSKKSYPQSDFKASLEACDVTIRDCRIESKSKADGTPDEFHIKMSQDKLVLDLTFNVKIGGITFSEREDHLTYYNPVTKKYFGFFALSTKSEVTGTLTVNGKSTKVKGLGFNNYNRGTARLSDIQSKWLFGTIYAGDYTIYCNDSAAAKRYNYAHFGPLVLLKGNNVILSTFNCAAYPEKLGIDPDTKVLYPTEETFRASEGGTEVRGYLPQGIVLENSRIANVPGFPFTPESPAIHFFQFSEANIQIIRGGQVENVKGQAFREYMLLDEWIPSQALRQ